MRPSNIVEHELVEQAQAGDPSASRKIIELLHHPLRGFIYRLLGQRFTTQLDDISQDIFLKVFRTLDRFDPARGVKFTTWVFTYARNHCVDLLKKKRLPIVDLGMIDGQFGATLVDHHAVQPLRALESVEIRERYDDAMDSIPAKHRDVLMMRERGMDYPEIAAELGIAPGTIKSRLHRARAALRRKLTDLDPTEGALQRRRGEATPAMA